MALIKKITTGFVVQVFDTEKNRFVSQEFVAGDQVDVENENGEPTENETLDKTYLPFEMKQPESDETKVYTIINDYDGNDSFEVEATNVHDAADQALEELGWWVSVGEILDDEEDGNE